MRATFVKSAGIALVAAGMIGAAMLPAQADPPPTGTLAGVGSDTTQDVVQGLAPLSGGRIENWHASVGGVTHQSITVKGTAITRPNGSSEGRDALFRSMGGTTATPWATQPVPQNSGIIGFARSSSQPPATELSASGDVYYVPFALDAVTFATDDAPIAALNGVSLTLAQLNTLYEDCQPVGSINPSQSGGNVDLFVPQSGSGTRSFWQTTVAPAGFGSCVFDRFNASGQPVTTGGTLVQEHDGTVTSLNNSAVVPFSIAQWVAQANGVSPERRHGATLHPIAGTAPTTGSGTAFETNASFPVTRPVFNIVPAAQVSGPLNTATELAFIGAGSAVCTNVATITDFGFIDLSVNATDPWTCGATSVRAYPNVLP